MGSAEYCAAAACARAFSIPPLAEQARIVARVASLRDLRQPAQRLTATRALQAVALIQKSF